MLPYIVLYRIERGRWFLGLSPRKPEWTACRRWAIPPGGSWAAHVDAIGPAAERLDVLDFGPYPCFVAFPGGQLLQLQPPRYVLLEKPYRFVVRDLQTEVDVWSRGFVPATRDDVLKAAELAATGMNDRVVRRRIQDAVRGCRDARTFLRE